MKEENELYGLAMVTFCVIILDLETELSVRKTFRKIYRDNWSMLSGSARPYSTLEPGKYEVLTIADLDVCQEFKDVCNANKFRTLKDSRVFFFQAS